MIAGIEFDEFAEWLPLPFHTSGDELVTQLLQRFESDPTPDQIKTAIAEQLVTLRDQINRPPTPDFAAFTTFVLLPHGGQHLRLLGVVIGALMPVRTDMTAPEFTESLIDEAQLHQPVDVTDISSPLGPATMVRARTHATTDHGLTVSETITVFWLVDGEDKAIVLTTMPLGDLVVAADVASALTTLAGTARAMDDPA